MNVRAHLVAVVHEVTGVTVPDDADSLTLNELEIDSLSLIEISMIMEDDLDIAIAPAAFDGVADFGSVVEVFDRYVSSGPLS